jgi:catechol 2,3-dioxygenase-like lactoylglutathione lyase family enzyme
VSPPALRLDHVVIHVAEWERSDAFYRDVLGAEVVRRPDGGVSYRFGDQQLNVHGPGVRPHPVAARPAHPGAADLCFVWPGPISAAVTHLRDRGVEVEEGPVPRSGARGWATSVYFRDPDGALLELMSYADGTG